MATAKTRVWLAQCVCPNHHCIVASAGEAADNEDAQTKIAAPLNGKIVELLRSKTLNPWCGLCQAAWDTWQIELGPTQFKTMGEASGPLEQLEMKNIETGIRIGEINGKKVVH